MKLDEGALGNAIKTARVEKHLSQEKLAEMVGVTPTHIKHMESGHRKPSIEVLYVIVKLLNISLDDVFFPSSSNDRELKRKIERLLNQCNTKELTIVHSLLEAMLF